MKTSRTFRGDRLYKIIRLIVNIITAFALFFGILGLSRMEERERLYMDQFDQCTNKYGPETLEFCFVYIDTMNEQQRTSENLLAVGILLPLGFYGGGKLIKYLFPKEETKQNPSTKTVQ